MYANQYKNILLRNSGVTGNLELEIALSPYPGNPSEPVHSKKKGDGYPHNDQKKFHEKLEESMKKVKHK